ncbi:MAG: M28 family peptidase [Planctomycetales bacterium]
MRLKIPRNFSLLILRLLILISLLWGASLVTAAEPVERTLDSQRAFGYLTRICRIGTRISGSAGMEAQQNLLVEHFAQFKVPVKFQPFDARHPLTGDPVRMNNLIVQWNPQAKERVLLACHYDTRPFPDRERFPGNKQGVFIGANDGASGVALFMELAHHMHTLHPTYGVDFVFFDGEELVYGNRTSLSAPEYFALQYRDHPPEHKYIYGLVVDMIGDRNLAIYQEKNSVKYAPKLVKSVWDVAQKLEVREFIPKVRHEVQDDHLPLNDVARIPTIDLIDFDYTHWHTTKDIPANCSGQSLAKVGKVLLEWLEHVPPRDKRYDKQMLTLLAAVDLFNDPWLDIIIPLVFGRLVIGVAVFCIALKSPTPQNSPPFRTITSSCTCSVASAVRKQIAIMIGIIGGLLTLVNSQLLALSPRKLPPVYLLVLMSIVLWILLLALADFLSSRLFNQMNLKHVRQKQREMEEALLKMKRADRSGESPNRN